MYAYILQMCVGWWHVTVNLSQQIRVLHHGFMVSCVFHLARKRIQMFPEDSSITMPSSPSQRPMQRVLNVLWCCEFWTAIHGAEVATGQMKWLPWNGWRPECHACHAVLESTTAVVFTLELRHNQCPWPRGSLTSPLMDKALHCTVTRHTQRMLKIWHPIRRRCVIPSSYVNFSWRVCAF